MDSHLNAVPRAITRLLVFVAASLSVHALTLGSLGLPGITASPQRPPVQPPALHATLNRAQSPSAPVASADPTGEPPLHTEVAPAAEHAQQTADPRTSGNAGVLLTGKWYEASEVDVRAEPLTRVELAYPAELEGTGIVGRVRVLLFIDERGRVLKARIAASEPPRVFDQAAIKGWQDVRFSPARKEGVAVKSQKLLELDFQP